ncbi:MAG: hybrid sensor histidine kinase/response regulator [Bacteroidetes bacterium HGW-Bacteroidetes-1]|jgi:two-component system chemotaxis sensor kinase CheA|nr:MAG: hybrid sensor histidine kinase/response regulator [Bacteroidetes bacterium HGW-Bacteroidetes-1]
MDYNQEEFLRELLGDFKIEAAEHHQAIVNGLIDLEKNIDPSTSQSIIEIVFREIHSLKGAARAVNLLQIERLCMSMESVFHLLKKGILVIAPGMFDVFYQASDTLQQMIAEIDAKQKTISENDIAQLVIGFESFSNINPKEKEMSFINLNEQKEKVISRQPLKTELVNPIQNKSSENKTEQHANVEKFIALKRDEKSEQVTKSTEKETVRVATAKLYDLLRQAEEMISIKAVLNFQMEQLYQIENQFISWRKKFDDRLLGQFGGRNQEHNPEEVARDREFLKKHQGELIRSSAQLEQLKRTASHAIDELLLDVKKTLLYPFSSLLAIVPKIVRDLSKEYDKEIDLQLEGGDIEIDRRILEEMKDPLIHLIRNCIDHGVESKAERLKQGKPMVGSLKVSVSQDLSQKIDLHISDDGAGLNKEKLINAAIKSGIIHPDEAQGMSDKAINMLIFASGVSTSPFITDVSGRGLGMAIVAEKVIKMGGNIDIETTAHKGTSFTITLPQTLASFRGILVRASDQLFMVPTSTVLKAVLISPSEVRTVESKKTILYLDETIALVGLAEVLGLSKSRIVKGHKNQLVVLILQISQMKIAFLIDEVVGEFEGVVKSLGDQLKHIRNIVGSTLLGDGRIVPILQVSELMDSASQRGSTIEFGNDPLIDAEKVKIDQKHVLVAEDSITVRNMLRNFIESAGFIVKTAVDGSEAFLMLQNEKFDILVSDVEMPGMNGFELTSSIRQDNTLADMPIILVTALDSSDDRQRGMEAGANAYIVKGSFEKSNLIETIKRLI